MGAPEPETERGFGWEPPARVPRLLAAIVAAWLFPGAGHAVLGRLGRGLVFAVVVVGSFSLGIAYEGRLALIDASDATRLGPRRGPGIYLSLPTLQVIANAGVGPLDLIARSQVYGEIAYVAPREAGPVRESRLRILRDRIRSEASAYGTAYLWTAGLMNLLLLLDVWDIGRGRKP